MKLEPENCCVVGLQWGDEAKGKIVDILGDHADFVVRFNGGANAGHTVVWGDRKFKLSLLPTGILKPHLISVIGNGLVIYPPRVMEEIAQLKEANIEVGENLKISKNAHVIFPYHMEEERVSEPISHGIGTTGRGIGPCYQDKVNRLHGVRMGDLLCEDNLRTKLEWIVPRKNEMLQGYARVNSQRLPSPNSSTSQHVVQPKTFTVSGLLEEYLHYGQQLKPFITDTTRLLQEGLKKHKKILFEAAQGSLLDVDFGTYPYVTSSSSLPGGIWTGTGIPSNQLNSIIGIVKAYSTRVGGGPFPTELKNEIGNRIREIGREFGTVTGRPRRVGWIDTVALKYTAALSGANKFCLMLLDVLSGLEKVAIAVAYELNGKRIDEFPNDANDLEKCQPIYEYLPGWSEPISGIRRKQDLPLAAIRYIERIEALIGIPLMLVSVGPDRAQTIWWHENA